MTTEPGETKDNRVAERDHIEGYSLFMVTDDELQWNSLVSDLRSDFSISKPTLDGGRESNQRQRVEIGERDVHEDIISTRVNEGRLTNRGSPKLEYGF